MKTYIERTAVHELVKRLPKYQMFNYDRTKSLVGINPDDVDFGVDAIPAANVAEVRHGRWRDISWEPSVLNWKCSLCTKRVLQKSPYCPNCGARMEKEADHDKHPSDPV